MVVAFYTPGLVKDLNRSPLIHIYEPVTSLCISLPQPTSLVMPENDPDNHLFFKPTYAGMYGAELIAILLNAL